EGNDTAEQLDKLDMYREMLPREYAWSEVENIRVSENVLREKEGLTPLTIVEGFETYADFLEDD
ncbi:hypothetical protein, partial [Psychromonas aquimarina]|uniref:hypothetical protein n=1 Tax=Psychromonas aquimarina TaxID=444919 RepID=UPI00056971C7